MTMTQDEQLAWLAKRGVTEDIFAAAAHGWTLNGCGPGSWKSAIIHGLANNLGAGVDLDPCGNVHDLRYAQGGGADAKLLADQQLRRLILSWLDDVPRWRFIVRARIRARADLYYVLVREFGGQYFTFTDGTAAGARTITEKQRIIDFTVRATCYYPDASPMEGGFVDMHDQPLQTLQQFLAGQADFISVAMDPRAFPYGTRLRCPALDDALGRELLFRVVDTGSAFTGRGTSRLDICTANKAASLDERLNRKLNFYAIA